MFSSERIEDIKNMIHFGFSLVAWYTGHVFFIADVADL
ncbi:hypothetical protein CUZ56_01688 [Saezia sanguinis]|uniref:Uncharacterized protein n=1 Tax=Saezia sanguinis TaxID=1965230 RepID=A0A433SDR7_9BURK|nr:hypothetical protein CUZ56_01688 [Saezia sanguinis]